MTAIRDLTRAFGAFTINFVGWRGRFGRVFSHGRIVTDAHPRELIPRLRETREYVADLARRAGRDPEDVRIIAVSKKQPVAAIQALLQAGQLDFGENYIQEALDKQAAVPASQARWHFMGRLQKNKAKFIPGRFVLLHSLDSLELAHVLHKKCEASGCALEALLQVNLGREEQKGGVLEDDLFEVAEGVAKLNRLSLKGLMVLPPFDVPLVEKQRVFHRLAELREALESRLGFPLRELSMGMTDDFPQAIAEGATMVRIGTRIFGPRPGSACFGSSSA